MFLPKADRTPASLSPAGPIHLSTMFRSLLLFCIIAIMQCFGQAAQPDDQPQKISGTVINAVTKAPIPRALVFSSDNTLAMFTDGEGHFEFTENGIGRGYEHFEGNCSWLRAKKPGFLDECGDPEARTNFSDDGHTIALTPESLIYGRVSLTNSEALGGTSIELYTHDVIDGLPRWIPRSTTRTNSAGEFRFAELPAGQYKLLTLERSDDDPIANDSGKVFGFPPVFYPGAADFASAETIHLSAGEAFEADFSATRQPYYRVTIPVVDDTGGINVTVREQSRPGYRLGHNASAKRIEGFLPNGNYIVDATGYGASFASGTTNLRVNGAATEGTPITLLPAGSITLNVKEEFTDTARRSGGTFCQENGKCFAIHGPRSYLNAELESIDEMEPTSGGSARPPTGPNDDSLVIENVRPGRYWLRLNTGRGYVAAARMGDVDLLRQPLMISPGVSSQIDLELRDDTAQLEGTVTGFSPAGAASQAGPFARLWIYCVPLPDSPGQFQDLTPAQDGSFRHDSMAPGDYRILVFGTPQRRLPYRDSEAMKAYETKGQVVHLNAGQKVSVQVPMIAGGDSTEK